MSLASDIEKLIAMGATVSPPMVLPGVRPGGISSGTYVSDGTTPRAILQSLEVRRRNHKARAATAHLMWQLKQEGVRTLKKNREVHFHPVRRWRFDIAYKQHMLAVELQGMGSHQGYEQFRVDCEKFSEAAALGWTVMPILHSMVADGSAARLILQALRARGFTNGPGP